MAEKEHNIEKYADPAVVKKKLVEFKECVPINRFELDVEVAGQASLYKDIGELAVVLKHQARVKKDHLDYVKAKVKHDIRENPGKYAISKLNNDAVDEACAISEEYQKALADYSHAQYLADGASILLEAAAQRKSTLRDAVSLYVHEYYHRDQEMQAEKKVLSQVSENEVLAHRRRLANQRAEDTKEENVNEQEGN